MAKHTTFDIELAGKHWSGAWHVENNDVVVSSAYGSGRAALGRGKAENIAAKLLHGIVEHWRS